MKELPRLDHLAAFQSRQTIEDDMGGTQDAWVPEFSEWAAVKHLRGGEAVMQARLASRNPAILTVRNNAQTRRITSEWAVSVRDRSGIEKVYAVKEDPRPTEGGDYLEALVEG